MAKITSNQHLLIQFRLSDRSSLKIEFRVHLFFFNSKWLNFNQQLKYDSIDLYGELLQYQISKLWTLLNEFRTSANSVSFIRQTVLTSWISFSSFFNSKWLNFNQQLKYDSIDLYGELLQYQISKLWTLLNEFRTSANSVSFIRQTVLTSWISFSSFLNSKWLNFNQQLRNAIQSICMESYCDTKVSKLWTLLNKFSTTFSDVI